MYYKKLFRVFTILVLIGMLVSPFQVGGVSARPVVEDSLPPPPTAPEAPTQPGGTGVTADPLSKVDSELKTLAVEGGDQDVDVYILAEAGADLSKVVNVTETRPFPDGELVVATVKPDMITKMASHPDVKAAEVFHAIEAPIPKSPKEDLKRLTGEAARELRATAKANLEERPFPQSAIPAGVESPAATNDWNGVNLIGAPAAWDKGFTGEGVNIAILDSGVDFGNPDLEDKVAFYDGGPYDGWPIALDPHSMRGYYYNGWDNWTNYSNENDYSWYASVFNVIVCIEGESASFDFDGFTYTIDEDITAMSLSGEIRWSVHPDIQLPDYVSSFGEWMPFILVDAHTAGVYDTVIADLNYDRWFDMYDDTAVLGTSDPVLNQDIGSYVYTDTQVMTGTLYVPSGFWWYPPIWYGWDEATEPMTLTAGTFIYALNHDSGEDAYDGADGVADLSGGMVYYIADGERPIPGMDYLYPGWGPAGKDPLPLNGQLVAFMLGSDYVAGYDHGTLCASAAAAGGKITGYYAGYGEWVQFQTADYSEWPFNNGDPGLAMDWLKPADVGTVQGPAKGAKIIALGANYDTVNGMQGFYDSYTFLAYGVDGVPNSGDEFVQIASMSYGDGSVHNDGWDWESRLISYYNKNYLPNTTFTASSGNGGWGFGTVNSPQGDTTVTVGASTQYGATTVFGSALTSDQINDGDVQPFSGRGPDALGRPDPDVVATGAWGAGDMPLNMSPFYHWYFGSYFPGDGNNAWYEWGGTSRSSPEAAGVLALIYQAYKDANGVFPDYETARQILMSGADDLNHDVLMQGAGRVNADRATDVAGGMDGVFVTPSMLAAGEYKGSQYESFPNVLFPGDTWSQTFTVYNEGASAASVDLGDEVLMEMETISYTQVVSPYLGTEGPYPGTYYYSADYLVETDPSLATGDALVRVAHASPDAPSVEVCVNGGEAFQDVPFEEVTSYAPLPPDSYLVQVFPAFSGCTGTPVISATLPLASFTDYTIVATDYLADITPIVLVDDNSMPTEGNAHVRFVHASPDAPAVDIAVVDGPVLFSDIAFQEASEYLPVPGDTTYDLEVRLAGTTTVVLTVPGVYLAEGEVYTIFAMGEATALPSTLAAILVQDTPTPTRTVYHGADLAIPVPEGADFMQVQLTVPFEIFDFAYQDPDPATVSYDRDQRWSLTVYDWTDQNGDGKLWGDANDDGVVSVDYGDLVDVSWTGQVTQTEINRFSYGYNYANEQEVTVRLGDRPVNDIVIGIVHRNPNDTRPGWGPDEYQSNPFTIKVIFYQKTDWDLVDESTSTLSVPAGSSATFDAIFDIPADQPAGLYEGAITVDDGTHVSIIPTTVNVAVPGSDLLFNLGGTPAAGTPYDNGRMTGGYTWYNVLEEGDWRFYFYDAEAGMEQQYLYVQNQWGELCGNMPTFNETLVWGPNMGDQFSMMDPDTYGPYGNQFAGGTWDANGPQNGWYSPRVGSWYENGDGIALPESRAWATLWDGLNEVQFRNILLSGKHYCGEGFDATAGVFGVDVPETGMVISTDQPEGSFTLDAVSPVDGLIAYASGFGQAQFFNNQVVPQGEQLGDQRPPPDLMDGWVYTFDAKNLSGIEAQTQGPGSSDIDLYLLYDANNDGVFNPQDNREYVAWSANWGSWESIWYSGNFSSGYNVQDGKYAIVMYGFSVVPGDEFDLKLTLYGGDALSIEGSTAETNYVIDATPGTPETLQVNWTVPGAGVWYGYLWFATPWDEEGMYHYMGPGIYVPVIIDKEGVNVSIEKDVSQEMVDFGDIITYTIKIENNGAVSSWMSVSDVLPQGLGFYPGYGGDSLSEVSDGISSFSGITSTLATEIPDYFASNCDMWYDEWMRTVHYECDLPINYEGKMYTSDTISFQVRVEAQPGTEFFNKADLKAYIGETVGPFVSDTAYSYVRYKYFLPMTPR